MKAILFDSNNDIEKFLESQLETLFISLDKATNYSQFLGSIKTKSYQIIFLGPKAHLESDFLISSKVRELQPDAIIIVVVDQNDTNTILKAVRSDIDGFLVRPFEIKDIRHILRKVMNSMLSARRFKEYRQEVDKQLAMANLGHTGEKLKEDPLTGLLNRVALFEILEENKSKGIILINLDNFSQINLGYGFHFGDEILRSVGNYLKSCLPDNGMAFRLHGDEFAIILINPQENQEESLAYMIHRELPLLNLNVLEIGVKVGCSIGYDRGNDHETYRHASIAILEARRRGRGRIQNYSPDLNFERKQKENIIWINRLKSAFEEGRIKPWFQPILNNRTGKINKYECLIRMMSRRGDVIAPGNFIQAAEMAGLLPLITGAVVESAFPLLGKHPIELSMNISDQDFRGLFLVEYLSRKIEELQVEPSRITLEILEDAHLGSSAERASQIRELKEIGFKIALDDFGVNSSNFSRISEYRPDYIKIDGRFIRGIAINRDNQRIVNLIHQVATGMGAETVAEFVANQEDYQYLVNTGIEYSQGNLIGLAGPFSLRTEVKI